MTSPAEFSLMIKSMAALLGFDKVGITPARQPKKSDYLNIWLDRNFHGEMHWLNQNREKRLDIDQLFPGAKSVVCVAHNYYTPYKHVEKEGTGKISRYAWGNDYHRIIKKKLKQLLRQIKTYKPEANGQVCVDTAPIMEKLWAEQAGLGWQGKHTNLITRDFGSWIFLGELVLDQELVYDKPAVDACGSCQACIQACPTGAISEPYVLNATKCISYLTIEYWNQPIPEKFQKKMKRWIFGCDICQDVCPWNKFSRESHEQDYYPDKENLSPDLEEWSLMDEETYKKKFKKSPLSRPGFKNFIRNIESGR
jgi:epoxyqueuosine reductase